LPRPFRHIRSRFACLAQQSLAALAVIGLVGWPSAELEYEGAGFFPQIILIVDESGSMSGDQDWLADFVPALGKALSERNQYDLPAEIEFTVAGFTDDTRNLLMYGSVIEATDAIGRLRADKSIEDGYVAIRELLEERLHRSGSPTTVILITDEDRDVTDPDVTLASLTEYLDWMGIVVHSIIPAEILCPDRKRAIAMDQHDVALQPDTGGLSSCENALRWTHEDYAELAFITGGLTWDLGIFAPGWRRQASVEVLEQAVAGLSDRILTQWPATVSARVNISPAKPLPGDVVTFDGSNSFVSQPGRQIISWAWDLDSDGAADEYGAIVARIFSSGRHRIVLEVADDATPPVTSRKVIYLEVGN
jgi:hypothetical protein